LKQLLRLAIPGLIAIAAAHGAETLRLDVNENLFYVLTAINAAGYDDGIDLPDNSPIRKQVREYLASQPIPVLNDMRTFLKTNGRHKNGVEDLAQYISYALSVKGPPDFAWSKRDVEVPPDALAIAGFTPLLADFYQQAKLDQLWAKVEPAYERELERYHSPILKITTTIDGYLRVLTDAYMGRRFQVFVDLMAPPEQVQTRNYGDDAFVVLTTSPQPRAFDIRHAYLHFQIDPIIIKYGMALQNKRSLLDIVPLAPLDEHYKNDFVLLANECLIKAVECRLDKNRAGVDQAMRQGFILTQYFYEALPGFEQQQQGMRYYAEDMINAIDLRKETARLSSLKFDAAPLQRAAKQVTVAGPEASPAAKSVEQAEDLYFRKSFEDAKKLYLKALQQQGPPQDHALAWYGLARVALQQNEPENAIKFLEKTLSSSPDPETKGWTYVYMARLARAAHDAGGAAKFYQEALAVQGASPRALEAARKESQNRAGSSN
jgi:tetratricopeptide (TPR) repeat protein